MSELEARIAWAEGDWAKAGIKNHGGCDKRRKRSGVRPSDISDRVVQYLQQLRALDLFQKRIL
jgi:hypothetical protein